MRRAWRVVLVRVGVVWVGREWLVLLLLEDGWRWDWWERWSCLVARWWCEWEVMRKNEDEKTVVVVVATARRMSRPDGEEERRAWIPSIRRSSDTKIPEAANKRGDHAEPSPPKTKRT